jgi:hypothetical protein
MIAQDKVAWLLTFVSLSQMGGEKKTKNNKAQI